MSGSPQVVQKVIYFDIELDDDLLRYFKPFFDRKRGSEECLRLIRLALSGQASHSPAPIPFATAHTVAPRAQQLPLPDSNKVESARSKSHDFFGGFGEED